MFKRNLFIFAIALTLYANSLDAITVNPEEFLSDSESDSDEMNMNIEHSELTPHFVAASEFSTQSSILLAPPGTGITGGPAALAAMHGLSYPLAEAEFPMLTDTMLPAETAADALDDLIEKIILLAPINAGNFQTFMNAFAHVVETSDDWEDYTWIWDGQTLKPA